MGSLMWGAKYLRTALGASPSAVLGALPPAVLGLALEAVLALAAALDLVQLALALAGARHLRGRTGGFMGGVSRGQRKEVDAKRR